MRRTKVYLRQTAAAAYRILQSFGRILFSWLATVPQTSYELWYYLNTDIPNLFWLARILLAKCEEIKNTMTNTCHSDCIANSIRRCQFFSGKILPEQRNVFDFVFKFQGGPGLQGARGERGPVGPVVCISCKSLSTHFWLVVTSWK